MSSDLINVVEVVMLCILANRLCLTIFMRNPSDDHRVPSGGPNISHTVGTSSSRQVFTALRGPAGQRGAQRSTIIYAAEAEAWACLTLGKPHQHVLSGRARNWWR